MHISLYMSRYWTVSVLQWWLEQWLAICFRDISKSVEQGSHTRDILAIRCSHTITPTRKWILDARSVSDKVSSEYIGKQNISKAPPQTPLHRSCDVRHLVFCVVSKSRGLQQILFSHRSSPRKVAEPFTVTQALSSKQISMDPWARSSLRVAWTIRWSNYVCIVVDLNNNANNTYLDGKFKAKIRASGDSRLGARLQFIAYH